MRVHHLNCGTLCPHSARLVNGEGSLLRPGRLVCHCLLVEGEDGLVLVDTGFGRRDLADPRGRLGRGLLAFLRPRLLEAETAAAQVERLGFSTADVRHVVLTHLDPDHAGGIADFPRARVHLSDAELGAAERPLLPVERQRYRPALWAHGPEWVRHAPAAGERWFGFDGVSPIGGAGVELLLVPLAGHSRGHAAVAVRAADGWLLHCGDAYFFHGELEEPPRCPPGLRLTQRLDDVDRAARLANQARLRALARRHGAEVRLFCSHDPVEHARMAAAPAPPATTATSGG